MLSIFIQTNLFLTCNSLANVVNIISRHVPKHSLHMILPAEVNNHLWGNPFQLLWFHSDVHTQLVCIIPFWRSTEYVGLSDKYIKRQIGSQIQGLQAQSTLSGSVPGRGGWSTVTVYEPPHKS